MKVTILVFAGLRESLGREEISVDVPSGATAARVRGALKAAYPALQELLAISRLAQGETFLGEQDAVNPDVPVAVIPPVSGGDELPEVDLTADPLDPAALMDRVRSEACGAVDCFLGTVRTPNHGKTVVRLEYEAHKPMAVAQMEKIIQEVKERWPGSRAALHHRVGALLPGEISVVAVVATPHRAESFEACRHLIERLKQDVPIWKKEVYPDGSAWTGAMGDCLKTE